MRWRFYGAFLLLLVALVGASVSAQTSEEAGTESNGVPGVGASLEDRLAAIDDVRSVIRTMKEQGCDDRDFCLKIPEDGEFQGDETVSEVWATKGWVVFVDIENDSVVLTKKAVSNQETGLTLLEGPVWVQQEDLLITARKARVTGDGDEQQIVFEEEVYLRRENEEGVLEFELRARSVDYRSATKRLVAQEDVEIRGRDFSFRADFMEYDDESNVLVLRGNVQGSYNDQEFVGQELRLELSPEGELLKYSGSGPATFFGIRF